MLRQARKRLAGPVSIILAVATTFVIYIYRLALRGIMNGYPCGGPGEPCGHATCLIRPSANASRGQLSKIAANTFFPECDPPRR
jgi:hypothetical protein